jgi:hypothetical protein
MSSDNEKQSIATQNTEPWSVQSPYLEAGFKRAKTDVLNNPTQYYPNSTVVPFSPQTNTALQMMEQRALSGDPTVQAGKNQVGATVGGDYLNSNPHLNQAIQNATNPVIERFQEDVIPGIQAGFSQAGRYGSGLQARQQERAGTAALDQMGNIATSMSYDNYGDERSRMMQGATLAPGYGQVAYQDIGNLANVGTIRENLAGSYMQDDINRFTQQQQAPKTALADYMALVGGGQYGGSSASSKPIYSNTASDWLGGAATAAGIAGSLWGQGGIWPQ